MKLLFVVLLALLGPSHGLTQCNSYDEGIETSCCPLTWSELSNETLKHAISPDSGETKYYYGKTRTYGKKFLIRSNATGFEVVKSDTDENHSGRVVGQYVLTNCNNCSLKWLSSEEISTEVNQRFHLPKLDEKYHFSIFTRKHRTFAHQWFESVTGYFDKRIPFPEHSENNIGKKCQTQLEICELQSAKHLVVDCKESARKFLQAQLQSIELNEESLLRSSVHVKLETAEVPNPEKSDLEFLVTGFKDVEVQFDLKLDNFEVPFRDLLMDQTNLEPFKQRSSNSKLHKLYSLPNADTFLPHLNSNGEFRLETPKVRVTWTKKVWIPRNSNCKITTVIKSLNGQKRVTVKFAIVPVNDFENYWTNAQILDHMRKNNINTSQLTVENGKLTFEFSGTLVVSTFLGPIVGEPICGLTRR